MCGFIILPARIQKTEKYVRWWRLRWSKAVLEWNSSLRNMLLHWGPEGVNGGKLPFYYENRGSLTDADTMYDQYFRTGTTKRTNYSNPEFDKIIEEEQKIQDSKKRVALLQQAGKIIMEEALMVPLYNLADIYGLSKNLAWKIRPDEKVLSWDMKIIS